MKPLNIFIVDDDKDFAKGLGILLEIEGHHVEFAFKGEDAVRKFQEKDFDITFMDVKLPGMNGVESFFEIRKLKPNTKVVMMTGHSVEQLLDQAVKAGALGVLHKPFKEEDLSEMLSSIKPARIILIADDDPDFVREVENLLRNKGYRVLWAKDGRTAMDKVLENDIDVLILDLKLPILSGLQVYLELMRQGKDIPTLIVTDNISDKSVRLSHLDQISVDKELAKSGESSELLHAIEKLLGK